MRGLKLNRYGGLDELLKERQQITKLLEKAKKEKNEDEIKKQNGKLKKLEKPTFDQDGKRVGDKISNLQAKVEEAKRLIESGDIQGAKKLFEIKRVEGLRCDADVCSYLVGMIAEEASEDLDLIIDTFSHIKLKNVFIHRTVSSAMHNLLKVEGLDKSEKIALLKKIVTPIREWSLKPRDKKAKSDQGNLQKDFYRAMSTLNLLTKLGEVRTLKELIDSPMDIKKIMEDLFKQKFDLEGVEDLYEKYEETLGNDKKFRDPTALFIYLGSLETIGSSTCPDIIEKLGKEDVITLLSTYVRDVLEGSDNFVKNRYDLEQSPHLKTIFESKPELLELWKENRSGPVSKSAENQGSTASKINYLEIFKQKNHHRQSPRS
jgi:hypothetical protein